MLLSDPAGDTAQDSSVQFGTTVKFASLPILKIARGILVTDGVKRPTFIQATVVRYISPRFSSMLWDITVYWRRSQTVRLRAYLEP